MSKIINLLFNSELSRREDDEKKQQEQMNYFAKMVAEKEKILKTLKTEIDTTEKALEKRKCKECNKYAESISRAMASSMTT